MIKKVLFYLLFSLSVFGQQKQIETSIDTLKNKIGAEFKLSIKTTVVPSARVQFPKLKNIGAMEVIYSYPIDTVLKGSHYELIKKYGLTQFDSGNYKIPPIKIIINKKEYFSDSLQVEVHNIVVDTLTQKMYDIKDIIPVESSSYWWIYALILVFVLGAIGLGIYVYLKKNQKEAIVQEVYQTPIERATILLETLENKKLLQKGEIKTYYSELTDIVRNYIEEAIDIPAKESTTSQLIDALRVVSAKKKIKLSPDTIENLQHVLKQADLVKFAKSIPLDYEIEEDCKKIQKTILILDRSIPVEISSEDDISLSEAKKQQQIKILLEKKRKNRIIITVSSVILLLILTIGTIIFIKGFDYLKDNILGNHTKELLDGQWIKSQYGDPGIIIETPKVLKRTDLSKTMPQDGMALIKEMQSFSYGDISNNLYLMVSTLSFKQETTIDLSKALESSLKLLEVQGAQNMLTQQVEFDNKQGIKGIKGYGAFSKLNEKEKNTSRMYYEIILFNQAGGLQEILIVHEEGDKYAGELSQRIFNSVELKLTN